MATMIRSTLFSKWMREAEVAPGPLPCANEILGHRRSHLRKGSSHLRLNESSLRDCIKTYRILSRNDNETLAAYL
jgi:hypothetical protein